MAELRLPPSVAIFGGAFDPIHRGHEAVIDFLKTDLHFKNIVVLPTGDSAYKRPQATAEHRLACIELALKGKADIRIEKYEMTEKGPHFTSRTLTELNFPAKETTFVIGTDQFLKLETWRNFPEVLSQCHWLILYRAGINAEATQTQKAQLKALGAIKPLTPGRDDQFSTPGGTTLSFHPVNAPNISSTEIRREIALFGAPGKGNSLHPEVDSYLKQHELYGRVP